MLGRRQLGQSLVEMAIALIVLVPLAVGVMLLGQYIHIKQQTQSAARAAAWAATVDPSLAVSGLPDKATVQAQLRARQFTDSHATFSSGTNPPAQFDDAMLTTFAGQPLLKPDSVVLVTYKQETAPSYVDKALAMIGKVASTLPPNSQGLVTAEVHASPEKIIGSDGNPLAFLDPLDTQQLEFSATTVLLADTWGAAGAGEDSNSQSTDKNNRRTVRNVIRPLVPTDLLGDKADAAVNKVVNVLGKIPFIDDVFTPGLDQYRLGRTAPDVVPTDKLVKYADAH